MNVWKNEKGQDVFETTHTIELSSVGMAILKDIKDIKATEPLLKTAGLSYIFRDYLAPLLKDKEAEIIKEMIGSITQRSPCISDRDPYI